MNLRQRMECVECVLCVCVCACNTVEPILRGLQWQWCCRPCAAWAPWENPPPYEWPCNLPPLQHSHTHTQLGDGKYQQSAGTCTTDLCFVLHAVDIWAHTHTNILTKHAHTYTRTHTHKKKHSHTHTTLACPHTHARTHACTHTKDYKKHLIKKTALGFFNQSVSEED